MWLWLLLCAQLLKFFICSIAQVSILVMYQNGSIVKVKSHPDVVDNFKEILFYNKPIEKPNVKRLKNIDQLAELPFYERLNVIKTNCQLNASKSSIKGLFSDLLNGTKGFKNQSTVKVLLKRYKLNEKLNLLQFISIQQQKQW